MYRHTPSRDGDKKCEKILECWGAVPSAPYLPRTEIIGLRETSLGLREQVTAEPPTAAPQ
ncbi:hypothetical protein E2C01_014335 [Portunus trituberculatus]|uniref:Uncharacterized protein n=1 Tax=Portunus trituberculatus TaxID=210409 RepID=A0A5B7DII3_PORTR|nr:hypothetical protein [Portunus trituberculatus]